jgi:hypothetical protein
MFEPWPANYRYARLLRWIHLWGYRAVPGYVWNQRNKRGN